MKNTIVKTASEQDFFARGRRIATAADAGKRLPRETVISFEEPADLLRVLTSARLDLFRAILAQADSITGIATRLQRDRSAVKRDVDELALAGLISVEEEVLPGHGRMKRVRAVGQRLTLQAQLG
jgi:predicted transcriptional regulator